MKKWVRLDNAAKIFPPPQVANTLVFRYSCELDEPVDPAVLQEALDRTISEFDVFQYVMRRGLFGIISSRQTCAPSCARNTEARALPYMSPGGVRFYMKLPITVRPYNLEVYHALTDGTGARHFMEPLVTKYLSAMHNIPGARDILRRFKNTDGRRQFPPFCYSKNRAKRPKTGQCISSPRASLLRGQAVRYTRQHVAFKSAPGITQLRLHAHRPCFCAALLNAVGLNCAGTNDAISWRLSPCP